MAYFAGATPGLALFPPGSKSTSFAIGTLAIGGLSEIVGVSPSASWQDGGARYATMAVVP